MTEIEIVRSKRKILLPDFKDNVHYKANEHLFKEILNLIEKTGSNYIRLIKKDKQLINFINAQTPKLANLQYNLKTRIFWIIQGYVDFPVCPVCKKSDGYMHKNVRNIITGYQQFCSVKCASQATETIHKRIMTCRINHGVDYPAQCEQIREKQNATKFKIYGSKNNIKKVFSTKEMKYGNRNWNNSQKCALTKLERYGSSTWNNSQKARETNLNKSDKTIQLEKQAIKQTFYKRYGKKCFLHSEEYNKRNLANKAEESIEKKYGKRKFFATNAFKVMLPSVLDKINKSKSANHTFSSSKPEKEAYWMLKFIFPKLQTQHKSDAYPFVADFYDPSQPNVRFEFQGSWTHGRHPFNPSSEEDQNELKRMQEKGSEYYRVAIDVWTRRDPMKREVAKKNGIQLIEFWNLEEVRSFVVNYFRSK